VIQLPIALLPAFAALGLAVGRIVAVGRRRRLSASRRIIAWRVPSSLQTQRWSCRWISCATVDRSHRICVLRRSALDLVFVGALIVFCATWLNLKSAAS